MSFEFVCWHRLLTNRNPKCKLVELGDQLFEEDLPGSLLNWVASAVAIWSQIRFENEISSNLCWFWRRWWWWCQWRFCQFIECLLQWQWSHWQWWQWCSGDGDIGNVAVAIVILAMMAMVEWQCNGHNGNGGVAIVTGLWGSNDRLVTGAGGGLPKQTSDDDDDGGGK